MIMNATKRTKNNFKCTEDRIETELNDVKYNIILSSDRVLLLEKLRKNDNEQMIAPYRNGQAEMQQPVIYEGGTGDPSENGRFTSMLEQAIERSLSLPGNSPVDIFTQIIENLRPRDGPGSGSASGQSSAPTPMSPQCPSGGGGVGAVASPGIPPQMDCCIKNAQVSKVFYQHNALPHSLPQGYLIVGFKRSPQDQDLLVVAVHQEVTAEKLRTNDDTFTGMCLGCGEQLLSYTAFCQHFMMEPRDRAEVFQFYCMHQSDTGCIQTITIPFPESESKQSPQMSSPPPQSGPMIVIPDQLDEKICFLSCMMNTSLNMEGNFANILESPLLERCFRAQQDSTRSVLSRECMILLLCLELSRLEASRLLWSEQLDYTFNKARNEIQRQVDRDTGIFPKMFMDIARLLTVTSKSIQLIRSDSSMSDAITQSWSYLLGPMDSRPRFIVCIYDGSSPAEFLVIARQPHLVEALDSTPKTAPDQIELLCKLIQSKLPHSPKLKLPQPKGNSPPHEQPVIPQQSKEAKYQEQYADDYCQQMIDNELSQSTIVKTLHRIQEKFTSMDQFKTVRKMIIVNDTSYNDAKRALPDNDEIYGLDVFNHAVSSILQEINTHHDTLWIFCFLGVSHQSYDGQFYQSILPLLENEHTLMFFLAYRPYHLFCDGSPLRHSITLSEGVPVLDDCEYGIRAHFNSLSTTTPTVLTSEPFDQLVELYLKEDQIHLDLSMIRLTTLIEHCYVSSFYHIESDHETPLADYVTFDMINRILNNNQPGMIRTESSSHGQLVYSILNSALSRHDFAKVKLAIVLYDASSSEPFKLNDQSKSIIRRGPEWSPTKLTDFCNMPCLIIYAAEINDFSLISYPLFSTIDMRLIMNGYFTRLEFEKEFLLATSYNKAKSMGNRTSAEWQAIQALQGLGQGKRKGGDNSDDDESQRKKIKVENEQDENFCEKAYTPCKVILSNEAYSLFRHSGGDLNYTGIIPARECQWAPNRHFSLSRNNSLNELMDYYGKNCKSLLNYGNGLGATSRRFVVSLSHCVEQTTIAREICREIEQKIRSQFTVDVLDESEIDVHATQPNLSLTKRDQLYFSPILNSIPPDHLETYTQQRHRFRSQSPTSFTVELSHVSMVPSRSRKQSDNPHAVWPLSLNVPQLPDGPNVQVEMIIPNEKRNCFVFDSNGLRSLRLKQQDLNERDENMKLLCKTIIVSFGIGGATKGHYDLTRAMDGTDYAHIVVVKHCDRDEYQDYLPSACLLVMHPDFDQYGIGCMKLFAQRLLQHSWALSPNECWPFCFFLDDDVTQFKKWNATRWDDISLYQLLIELEQKITIDIAMVGFRGWNQKGLEGHSSRGDTSKRLVTGSYLLNLNNDVLVDHTKYEAEDIDFSLRQFCAGNTCLVFERISVIRKDGPSRVFTLPITSTIDDYIVPVHIPHGMDPKPKINAPAFYLLNQYLKVKATELFEVANREGLPVLQTGRYQNLTHNINVEFWTDSSRGNNVYAGLILLAMGGTSRSTAFPTDRELEEIKFTANSRLLIIANDSNTIRNVLAMNPTIEDKWEVRFSNERQTNNPKPIVLLTGTRKQSQSYYPDPSFKMETPKSIL